jgi:hypothetical protein
MPAILATYGTAFFAVGTLRMGGRFIQIELIKKPQRLSDQRQAG